MSSTYWLEHAWLGSGLIVGEVLHGVLTTVVGTRFTNVRQGVAAPPPDAIRLAGMTIPGMANAHSHAFHRALRGRTQQGRGSFWTWREQMYAVAGRLTPDKYYALAKATYREMLLGGITAVGEFHYLHHGPDGVPYDDPNAMGAALIAAARDAGMRIALIDTCYLAAGIGRPAEGVQLRFADGDASAWAARVETLAGAYRGAGTPAAARPVDVSEPRRAGDLPAAADADVVVGAAVHSVRAVPRDQMSVVAAWAAEHGAPLHVHLSEQVAENDECTAACGLTPTQVLAEAEALGELTTAVHATHLTAGDIALLGSTRTSVCFCPTTERDLGDGIGPSRQLREAGAVLTLGSDSHAVIDLFEEMRAVEMNERLATRQRGHWSADELLAAATYDGHRSIGFPDAGRIMVGHRADMVTVDVRGPRIAGAGASVDALVFAASAADVTHVVAGGRLVATTDERADIGRELAGSIAAVTGERS